MIKTINYWRIQHGLRGCYMPDSQYVIHATTRRALKEALQAEAAEHGEVMPSKRDIASLAAAAWRQWHKRPDRVHQMPMAINNGSVGYGLFVAPATREEYREYLSEND